LQMLHTTGSVVEDVIVRLAGGNADKTSIEVMVRLEGMDWCANGLFKTAVAARPCSLFIAGAKSQPSAERVRGALLTYHHHPRGDGLSSS
jgi:hypothetical protein